MSHLHPSRQKRHVTCVAVHAHPGSVGDALGRVTRPDHAGDAVLPGNYRRMRQQAAAIGHDRAKQREKDVESLGRRLGHEDVSVHDPVELRWARNAACGSFVDTSARSEPTQPAAGSPLPYWADVVDAAPIPLTLDLRTTRCGKMIKQVR